MSIKSLIHAAALARLAKKAKRPTELAEAIALHKPFVEPEDYHRLHHCLAQETTRLVRIATGGIL